MESGCGHRTVCLQKQIDFLPRRIFSPSCQISVGSSSRGRGSQTGQGHASREVGSNRGRCWPGFIGDIRNSRQRGTGQKNNFCVRYFSGLSGNIKKMVMAKKSKKDDNPRVNAELEGFKMNINTFGEISSSFSIDKINEFLNNNVDDKKLRDREDVEDVKKKKK